MIDKKLLFLTLLLTACGADDQVCQHYDWEFKLCPNTYTQPETYTPAPSSTEAPTIDRTPTRPNGGQKRYSPYGSYTNE